ncbi:MAG: glycosyltransferase [Candidatus Micrarchaeota archaeon]|nr:glycosyltransferase [Candidatus Micrarchaeota archaeon]
MRIAFFTDTYLPNTDGVVTAIQNSRAELELRGHEVYIFSPGTKKQKEENKDKYVNYFTSASFKPYPDYRIAIPNFFSIVKVLRELNLDIIHSHGIATTGLAAIHCSQKLNVPSIASFHTLVPEAMHYVTTQPQIQQFLQAAAWKYLHWYYSHFKKVLVPSEYIMKYLNAHSITNTILQPSGINLNQFSKNDGGEKFRKKFEISKKTKIVLFVGRIALEKKIEMIIESAQSVINLIPETKFVIVGKGPAENHYKDIVKKMGLEKHILFTGYIENDILLSAYAAADAFVFPSLFDTQGLSVIEAMASGVPAIVKKDAATAEFIEDDKNGYHFSDHFDFHEKIVNAIKNKNKLSENAKAAVKKFDIETATDKLLGIYETLIAQNKQKK